MGILDRFAAPPTPAVAAFADAPSPVADPGAAPSAGTILDQVAATWRAERVAIDIARSIPAVRKALAVIVGIPSTFALAAWRGDTKVTNDAALAQLLAAPMPGKTCQWYIAKTLDDLVWRGRSVSRISDSTLLGRATQVQRLHPSRWQAIPDPQDPDLVSAWVIDGQVVTDTSSLLIYDTAGLGGLEGYGLPLLALYAKLQAAAGRYADAPHPHAILKNAGADLEDDEITALLDRWEAARTSRSVGYLNSVMSYDTFGWSAKELQLTEAREQAALEVARLFGLPAKSLDAPTGDSMTYANVIEYRRDETAKVRPWTAAFEQGISRIAGNGIAVRMDTADYLRDDLGTRMTAWATAKDHGILTAAEIRAAEPLARSTAP